MSRSTQSDERQALLLNGGAPDSSHQYGTDASENGPRVQAQEGHFHGTESSDVQTSTRNNGDEGDNDDNNPNGGPRSIELVGKLSGVYIGAFLAALDSTLVGTLVGPISASFGDQRQLSWLASAFFIATCLAQPVVGKITDIYGRRPVIVVANLIFAIGNIICAIALEERTLLLGRVVAGLGAGSHGPVTTVIMSDLVPLRRRGVWQGTINVCFGVGSGLGGPLGGWLAETVGWRWAFAVQVPVTAVCVVLFLTLLPETACVDEDSSEACRYEGHWQKLKRIDWPGSVSLLAALLTLLFALNAGGSSLPWSHPAIIGLLVASFILLGVFVYVEARIAIEPVLPVALFTNRTILAACLTNWFCSMARFGLLFYVPLLFQLQGYSITETGLRLVPESAATAIASIGAGVLIRATGRFREQGMVLVLVQAIGIGLLATAQLSMPAWPPFICLFLCGLGYSGMITTTLVAVIASTQQAWQAVATSASYLFRSTGSVLGVTLASAVFQNALETRLWERLGDDGRYNNGQIAGYIDAVQMDMHRIGELPGPLQLPAKLAYLDALRTVFISLSVSSAFGLISATLVRHHRLYKTLSRSDAD